MTREELIAALEKATGPDRGLDFELWLLSGDGPGTFTKPMRQIAEERGGFDTLGHPYFTASIDAAVTLVPTTDGKRWYGIGAGWSIANARVRVYPPNPWSERVTEGFAEGSTPALALCAAALKAQGGGA